MELTLLLAGLRFRFLLERPLHIDPAADTYFIGKTGYEPKTGVTTRADIARYNALDPAADEKQRRHRQRLNLRRKIKKGFIRIKERICK